MSGTVPYLDLARQHLLLREELLAAAGEVLAKADFILGAKVAEFESWFSSYVGAAHAIGVGNGTDALELSLRAAGIAEGDEVITVPNTFIATVAAIRRVGATPILVDVGDDFCIDPIRLADAVSDRTRAVIPVHLYGNACDLASVSRVCAHRDIVIIEDAAQALGARDNGRHVGTHGIGAFSLHPIKTLGACGDAGIIATSDDATANHLRLMRNIGLENRDSCVEFSGNSRLDTLQAALLLVKSRRVEGWIERRRAHAAVYNSAFDSIVRVPAVRPGVRHTYSSYVVRCEGERGQRDRLIEHLNSRGVEARIHYPLPIHLQLSSRILHYSRGDFPVAERHAGEIVSLPSFPELRDDERARVVEGVLEFFK